MAQVLFCGGKVNSVNVGGLTVDSTTAGTFNATYADASLQCPNTTDTWTQTFRDSTGADTTVTTGQTLFAHFDFYAANTLGSGAANWVELRDSSNYPWLAFRDVSLTTTGVYGNTGTGPSPVWTLIDSTYTIATSTRMTIDIKLTLGSPHAVQFSVNGSLQKSGTFTQASLTSLSNIKGMSSRNTSTYFSQIIVTEGISTVGGFVDYNGATAAGTNTAWTGAYTDINEAVNNDATTLSAATAGLKSTFAMGDVTVPVGYAIKGVWNWVRAKNDGTAPANIKGVVRSSGVDYSMASNMTGIGTSYGPALDRRDTDPATGAAWTQAGWNAAEVGVESAT